MTLHGVHPLLMFAKSLQQWSYDVTEAACLPSCLLDRDCKASKCSKQHAPPFPGTVLSLLEGLVTLCVFLAPQQGWKLL